MVQSRFDPAPGLFLREEDKSPLRTKFVRSHSRFVLGRPYEGVLEIKYHRGVRVVALVFCILGWPILLIGILGFIDQLMHPEGGSWAAAGLALVWGGTFVLMGVWLFGPRYRFDVPNDTLTIRHFWRTHRQPLERIKAVQMIDAGWFGNMASEADTSAVKFQSYQLNLILKDRTGPRDPALADQGELAIERQFVTYNSDVTDMVRKAKILADFLAVPLLAEDRFLELTETYSREDAARLAGELGLGRYRGNDALQPVSDRNLPEPFRSWIDDTEPLPATVRLIPRTVAVLYDFGMFVTLGLPLIAMDVVILMMFVPPTLQGTTRQVLIVGTILAGICWLLALVPWYLGRRLIGTIGAWRRRQRGMLREGILVGPEGLLVRMEPNRCYPISLDQFVLAKIDMGIRRATPWSRHQETPDFVIETLGGPVAFFLDWSSEPPELLNRWVAEARSETNDRTFRGHSRDQ